MKRFTILDIVLSILTLALVGITLVPALARVQRTSTEASCQSNLRRWAEAMELYTSDHDGRYPTNRPIITSTQKLGSIDAQCRLSRPGADPITGNPYRFEYSINWVEALYPYVMEKAKKTGQDWKSFRQCPSASATDRRPNDPNWNCSMTYAFNGTLVEHWAGIVRQPEKVMMLRELSWLAPASLRPFYPVSDIGPYRPFLTSAPDSTDMPRTNPETYNLHGNGSYILFADGHVKAFDVSYFPDGITTQPMYEDITLQWFNYFFPRPRNQKKRELNKTIAITP